MTSDTFYAKPASVTRNVLNPAVAGLTGMGISVLGSRVLSVRGRRSGAWHSTPVNLLTREGAQYLVSPRGNTQWSRNLRVAGDGRLRLSKRVEAFSATELADPDKPAILRAYLRRWKFEVGAFFGGVGPDATEEELLRIAPRCPVFRIDSAGDRSPTERNRPAG